MEVEKSAPVSLSPLDNCRGRGKHLYLPRCKTPKMRRASPKASATAESPSVVLFILPPESQSKVGSFTNGK